MSEFQQILDKELDNCVLSKSRVSLLRKSISRQLVTIRGNKGITQAYLAKLTGIKQSNISKLENADYNITIEGLEKLADALDCEIKISFMER